ncbi:MAG: HD domain-containing protein [Desulfovibrio sp.]|jgi:HD-GYP domain-containing protein (c-di-GMP phosphodiesterase class II)|nr:HD domain-containing protein [Desulfovibrio sp.]
MAEKTKSFIPGHINDEFYQISSEILNSFPKYRPPVDLFCLREDIAVLAPYCRKESRLTNEQVEEVARICEKGNLFVSRMDHRIYSRHIIRQLDLVLQDQNLKEGEIADICIRALNMRYTEFCEQPVKAVFDPLYRDILVTTEYIFTDRHRVNAFVRRLFRKHDQARHAVNCMSLGLWLWLQNVAEYRRKDMDRMAVAFLMHDIGMCKVPAFLVNRRGSLKSEEREKVVLHPVVGVKLMQKIEISFEELLRACYEHHERMDGSGYPQKIRNTQISRTGRMTAAVDSFSAMISERPYARGKDMLEAARDLAADTRRYDSEVTKLLFSALAAGDFGQFADMDASLDAPA